MRTYKMKRLLLISSLLLFASTNGWAECISGNCVNGEGTYTYTNGSRYVGEFKDGKANGQGTYIWVEGSKWAGDKYVGEFKEGELTGQGTYTFANRDQYMGEFKEGERTGQGTYTYANGNQYVGEFKDSKRHGQGIYTLADGKAEGGIWADGKLVQAQKVCLESQYSYRTNCIGTNTLSNRDQYVGEFKDNKRHGQGTYIWADGRKHVGEWKDNKRHGQGTYTRADGTTKTGIWGNSEYLGTTEAEAERKRQEIAVQNRAAQKKYDRIYKACLIDKSSGLDMQNYNLRTAVEETCVAIAEDPSWWESWKYD